MLRRDTAGRAKAATKVAAGKPRVTKWGMTMKSLPIATSIAAVTVLSALAAAPAAALVTTYVTQGSFAAATTTTAFTDFESEAPGYTSNPLVSGGIRFTQLPGGHPSIIPYIAPIGAAGTIPEGLSQILEANGDENFRIELASNASFTAIGFVLYTNAYSAPVVSLYAPGGGLIGSFDGVPGGTTARPRV